MKASILTICLLLSSTAAAAQSARIAVVNGEVITQEQVNQAAKGELDALETRRLQFEADFANDHSAAIEGALDEMIAEKVLAAEARKRSMTTNELISAEIDSKLAVPSDVAVERFWVENQARINMTREQALPQIRMYLQQQDRGRALALYVEKLKNDFKVESYFEPARTSVVAEGPTTGPAQAPITIVEFSDFECPFCGALHPTLKEIEKNYPDKLRIVYRQFPLNSIHPNAQKSAEASLCAHDQKKFWEMHDLMFTDQRNLSVNALKQKAVRLDMDAVQFDACLDSGKYAETVRQDLEAGTRAGVTGTPALFVNGRFLGGNQPYEEIVRVIEDELRRVEGPK